MPTAALSLSIGKASSAMTASSFDILVVEDNPDFLHLLCIMLDEMGHRTHAAATAEQALELLDRHRFEVLIADVQLPGMSGIELARLVSNNTPGIRIVFSSGHGYLLADRLDFDFVVLHKPYFLAQLQQAIETTPVG
jgi:CheY-like chemotaxis protein